VRKHQRFGPSGHVPLAVPELQRPISQRGFRPRQPRSSVGALNEIRSRFAQPEDGWAGIACAQAFAGDPAGRRYHQHGELYGSGLRATLKLESVLDEIEIDNNNIVKAKEQVDSGNVPETTTYTDEEVERDLKITRIQGLVKVGKLYAPAVGLGIIGVVCLTKSHRILEERNVALTAAYVAVDRAFTRYRERVIDRFGEDLDRELRYDYEGVDIVDEETGKVVSGYRAATGDPEGYARWFDEESSSCWSASPYEEYNWMHLRQAQNWLNDMLRSRGYVFLNEAYGQLGLSHTPAGQIVGWIYDPRNPEAAGDNYIDFGCWDQQENPLGFNNGREGAILVDFNVDGPIWDLIGQKGKT
jgi:predicted regulator of amino acid metabolism with ACT domain